MAVCVYPVLFYTGRANLEIPRVVGVYTSERLAREAIVRAVAIAEPKYHATMLGWASENNYEVDVLVLDAEPQLLSEAF